jgi:hypothetical protein
MVQWSSQKKTFSIANHAYDLIASQLVYLTAHSRSIKLVFLTWCDIQGQSKRPLEQDESQDLRVC